MNRRTLMPLMLLTSAVAMLFAGAVGCPAALGADDRAIDGWAVTVVASRTQPAGSAAQAGGRDAGAAPVEWPATRRAPAI